MGLWNFSGRVRLGWSIKIIKVRLGWPTIFFEGLVEQAGRMYPSLGNKQKQEI